MRPKLLLLILMIMSAVALSGCWDLLEVDRRAFVTVVGIDLSPPDKIMVTVQIPLPRRIFSSGNTSGNQRGKVFFTIPITGDTAHDAFDNLQTETYRNLVIDQNKAVFIGEEAARQGVRPLLDSLIRNPKAPSQALVMIAHDCTAAEILKFEPVQEILPGEEFTQAGQTVEKYDRTYFIPHWRFMQRIIHGSIDTYAPLIGLDKTNGVFVMAGVAVFNNDRLAGDLAFDEAKNFGVLASLMRAGRMTFTLTGRTETLRNISAKTAIKVLSIDKNPFFKIKVQLKGMHSEKTRNYTPLTPKNIKTMQNEIAQVLKPKLEDTVKKLQQLNSDVINFGEELRVQQPGLWKAVDWKKIYPTVPFEVQVKVKIENNGIIY